MTAQNSKLVFISATKFVSEIKDKTKPFPSISASLYFEGKESFKNKFGKICIKPVFIVLKTTLGKTLNIKHEEILKLFNGQLCLSFGESARRLLPKTDNIYFLAISFERKEYNNIAYYPCDIYQCLIKNNVENIRKQKVQVNEELEDNNETEIPPDAF